MGTKKHIEYRYDSRGNRSSMTAPDGGRFTYSYDTVGRLQTVVNPQAQRTTFLYDLAGRRTETLLANGGRTSTVYDDGGRITAVYNRKSNGDPQTTFEYQYDNAGNRTSVVDVDGRRTTWTYDAASQLTGEHRGGVGGYRHTFTYDSRGNRTLKDEDGLRTTYAYDAANQLRYSDAIGGRTTYVYDADGNQQVTIEPTGDRTTNVWDYENRMSSAQLPTGLRNTMAYDPDGLRVKLEESGGVKKFVWDDQNYLAQADGSDVIQAVYTVEPQTYGNLISHRQGGQTTWYQFDALGSTRALTDAGQTILQAYHYGAWGTLLGSPTLLTPFLWVGRVGYHWDQETQNQYVRARYYRPVITRWMSIDPLCADTLANWYRYVANTVIQRIDPSGLILLKCACECGIAATEGGEACSWSTCSTRYGIGDCDTVCKPWADLYSANGYLCSANTAPLNADEKLVQAVCNGDTECERQMGIVLTTAANTAVRPNIPILSHFFPETCGSICSRWGLEFFSQCANTPFTDRNKCDAKPVVLPYPASGGPEHFVVLYKCNGKCFGIDQGAFGGDDHVFEPNDVLKNPKVPTATLDALRKAIEEFCGTK